ncbi:7, 8-dihydro-6-hydroxymethylpterin-pyrophosphokinase [Oryzomicrobium terrae]|uniref:2-amino-4-hydroxy-6-hydroxymethyldihydropteridine pyrophosphokinase n=1 Tax=Oryzomicrobium terrae TaxID=1735038 RepID=A0A5C1EC42_9RHOO|nr:2-amino-4-hydroxy-6-hydroxymethyldihydropteridine diphosphokinase [Oryzomicrobium terrae]QEL65848.1 7, 8-dihydro-6-hydroxymethylpterin-pyrophosphokinase [Oryzomicrobium terrae]
MAELPSSPSFPGLPHRAYVALGANLGDPVAQVHAALAALDQLPDCRLAAASSLYRTAAITANPGEVQPDYINAVAELATSLSPQALLAALLALESAGGRTRHHSHPRWAPRTLDLDLLLYDDLAGLWPAKPAGAAGAAVAATQTTGDNATALAASGTDLAADLAAGALPTLLLPHPRLHLRAFVLTPLAEIAPQLALPGRGSVAAWLPAVRLQDIEKLPE